MNGQPPIVLAVDPAKKTGVCVMDNTNGTVATLALDGDDQGRINALIAAVTGAIVVVESHGKPRVGGSNWAAIESLIQRRMRWQIACEVHGVQYVEVNNSTWQNGLLRSITLEDAKAAAHKKSQIKGKAFKARALAYCKRTWGYSTNIQTDSLVATDDLTEDERDAMCIAHWYSIIGWRS